MPEGDVLFRTASTLQRWLAGREVTAATTRVEGLAADRLVGRRIVSAEAQGKHLLIRFDTGHVLHCHLRMSGSWHVYGAGEAWRRPRSQARLVLTCGDHVAVCFGAPVLEVLHPGGESVHPVIPELGPDVLVEPLDVGEVVRRARSRPPRTALGELLLDQRVAAGIGNIWRCEALFAEGHHPFEEQSTLTDDQVGALVARAGSLMRDSLMRASLGRAGAAGALRTPRWVYGRAGRPCRRCGELVESRRQGVHARTAYWCPRCQARGQARG